MRMTASLHSSPGRAVSPKRDPLWDTLAEVTKFLYSLQKSGHVPVSLRDDLNRLLVVSQGVLSRNDSLDTLTAPRGYELALEVYKQCKEIDQMKHGGRGWLSVSEFPGDAVTLGRGHSIFWNYQQHGDLKQVYLFAYPRVMAWCRKQGGER